MPTRRPATPQPKHRTILVCLLLTLATSVQARTVIVNGTLLDEQTLAQLDSAHCSRIPDGAYWLRQGPNGVMFWGYAANPYQPMGRLGEDCEGAQTHHRLGNRKDPATGLWKGSGGDANCYYLDGMSFCP